MAAHCAAPASLNSFKDSPPAGHLEDMESSSTASTPSTDLQLWRAGVAAAMRHRWYALPGTLRATLVTAAAAGLCAVIAAVR